MLLMRVLTEHLIASETGTHKASGNGFPAADVCARLHPHLAMLMGETGFRALLARALTRAAAEVPSLRAIQVDPSGLLVSADAAPAQVDPAADIEGSVALVAHLLTLLAAFISERLALQILSDTWPQLQRNKSNSVTGDSA